MSFINVEVQKKLASDLIFSLRVADPGVMIAGGAPRDWYLNTAAKDLDIYLRLPNHTTTGDVHGLADAVGITGFKILEKENKDSSYAELPNLKWVFEGYYQGVRVNLMVMEKGVREEIVKDFDVAICRAWFDGYKCHYFEEFYFCVKTRVCLVHPKYTGKESHIRKMAKRFPQFMFFKKVDVPDEYPEVSSNLDIPDDFPPFAPSAPVMPMPQKAKAVAPWEDEDI